MTVASHAHLWQTLSDNGLVTGEVPEVIQDDDVPWYIRLMLGVAGWIGAIFLLGALFSGLLVFVDSVAAVGLLGVGICLVSVIIYRSAYQNDFTRQFAFALSLAGQGLLVYSALDGFDLLWESDDWLAQFRWLAVVLATVQCVLFLIIPNYLHRMWSALVGMGAVVFLCNQYGLYSLVLVALPAGACWLWLQEFRWVKHGEMLRTLGYSMVIVSLLHLVAQSHFWSDSFLWLRTLDTPALGGTSGELLASCSLGLVLLALLLTLLKRDAIAVGSGIGVAALILAALVAGIGVYEPGITVGLMVVLLGFSSGNTILTGLGLVASVVFISQFYYLLDLSLLQKSVMLLFSGLALLVVRQVLRYYRAKGAAHA